MKLGKLYICDGYYYLPTMSGLTFFDANGDHISAWIVCQDDHRRVATIYCLLLKDQFTRIADEWFKLVKEKYEVAEYTVRESF